ncbi:hypothetical protein DQ04_22101000 [Trypanosoma grayi]|uniref:hypothetical protein n=1 Tax=Trypanosoma grayi TaxID=71804 RepID=UPI0004F46F16|nr:hypothetical protein DQ04_22101000 [Trypanosoma grayi]KEG05427.1 hypothetical protein DQ04_22101000 [Trypanosoma grayi]
MELQRTIQSTATGVVEVRKAAYQGCRETNHRCESIGFYGRPKPDRSSVFFFACAHPMRARALKMDSGED